MSFPSGDTAKARWLTCVFWNDATLMTLLPTPGAALP